MARRAVSAELACDYAVPDAPGVFRMSLELDFPRADLKRIQAMVEGNRWDEFAAYMADRHPSHRRLVAAWVSASKERREEAERSPVVAIGSTGRPIAAFASIR